ASLNTRVADRSLFAGQAIDGPAIAEADTILSDLTIAVAGATTAADVEVIVDAWFDTPGGGFETIGYLGAAEDLAPMALGLQEAADFALRADDQAVRDMLKSFAMASLVAEGAFASDITERAELLRSAGERMFTANDEFNALRANLGVVEAEIENALVRNTAETAALELAQAEIIAIDPFKSATDLAAAENQLEMLYAITARLSRLTLVDYLR
ncbi:MAG: flagellar biosynthesis protein FlgL, partial [Pseudomonadota bacterium]